MNGDALTHLGLLGLNLLGLFALALATERHAEHVLGRLAGGMPAPRWRHLARGAGWLLLAASLALGIAGLGAGIGIALWLGWMAVAALALVFSLPSWPWRPPARARPERAPKPAAAGAAAAPHHPHRRRIAAMLLAATVMAFGAGLARVEPQPLRRADAMPGQVGPWSFMLAEAHRDAPELMDMDVPFKEYRLRFCAACDEQIGQVTLKVNRPRSARASGMAFMGQRWERRAEIPLPSTTRADSELWLTVMGKDGAVHQTSLTMASVSPATVAWFDRQRSAHAIP